MSFDKAMQNMKYDVRMTEYNLNNGLLKKEELQSKLKDLPDLASNVETIKLEEIQASSNSEDAH